MKLEDKPEETGDKPSGFALGEPRLFEEAEATGQREEFSRAEEIDFRAMYENTPVMMHSIGANQQLISVNRKWREVLGYEESEVIGRKSSEFLTEESRRYAVDVAIPKFIKTGSARDVVYQFVGKNAQVLDVLLSAAGEIDEYGEFALSYCYMLDVNEHRKSDELWRQMSLVEERTRMSRDIHDTVEHSLIRTMLRIETVRELMVSDPMMAREELESAHALAKLSLEQARRSVWDLQPLALTSNPLSDVISRGLSRLGDEGIMTSLVVDGEEPKGMDPRNKLAVIRNVQEAFSNIRLHSRAKAVEVRLSYTPSHVMLVITDDGIGFDPSTTHSALSSASRGIGLANMRECARLAGGSTHVRSAPGKGALVEVRIPFEHDPKQDLVLIKRPSDCESPRLTNREREVLQILANGGRNKDIAAEMSVSLHTAKFHVENLYEKLGVRTRAQLVRVATQRGLLTV